MRWPLQPLQPLQRTQLQPPFGQSVASLCHPWFTTTSVSYRFPILKLPPPPRAVLLVYIYIYIITIYNRPCRDSTFAILCCNDVAGNSWISEVLYNDTGNDNIDFELQRGVNELPHFGADRSATKLAQSIWYTNWMKFKGLAKVSGNPDILVCLFVSTPTRPTTTTNTTSTPQNCKHYSMK